MEKIVLILTVIVAAILFQINWLSHKLRKNIASVRHELNELWFSNLANDIRLLVLAGVSADEVLKQLEEGFRETSFPDEEKQRLLEIVKDAETWAHPSEESEEKEDE